MRTSKRIVLAIGIGVTGWAAANVILELILWIFGSEAAAGFSGYQTEITAVLIGAALIFAPPSESLAVWMLVWMTQSKLRLPALPAVLITSAVMVSLHGVSVASLAVLPTFALHATVMFAARARREAVAGYFTIVAAHFVQNAIGIIQAFALLYLKRTI
jgi:hypothetical protein